MLSDVGSKVIREYGILNTNVPPDTFFYGMPFPGDYLLAPDGVVRDKHFLPNYETRAAASEVLLKNFGEGVGSNTAEIRTDELVVRIALSADRSFTGQELGVRASFALKPGWHIYGQPLPSNYTVTAITFAPELIAAQSFEFPKATPVTLAALGETLPVYNGDFSATGRILTGSRLKPGGYKLVGTLHYQACNDQVCKIPQAVKFELPLQIDAGIAAAK